MNLLMNGGLSKHRCAQLTALCSCAPSSRAAIEPWAPSAWHNLVSNPGKHSLIRFLYWLCGSCEGQPFTWLILCDLQKKSNTDGRLISLNLNHFHVLISLDIFCICNVKKSNKPFYKRAPCGGFKGLCSAQMLLQKNNYHTEQPHL